MRIPELSSSERQEVAIAFEVLRNGGIILYPTDTIWGIGCNAESDFAVEKCFQLKKRKQEKSMIILVDSMEMLQKYTGSAPAGAIVSEMSSGRPVTFILDKGRFCAPALLAADGSIAIRITADPMCRALIHEIGRGLVSTSANVSGEFFSGNFDDISPEIINGVDYIFRSRRKMPGLKPSRIVKLKPDGAKEVLRE